MDASLKDALMPSFAPKTLGSGIGAENAGVATKSAEKTNNVERCMVEIENKQEVEEMPSSHVSGASILGFR